MKYLNWVFIFICSIFFLQGCTEKPSKKKTVWAIPVYGQSLALGEQAIRITDFDSFVEKCHHLVVTENLDEDFGYLSDTEFKQRMKKLFHDRHRAFELSIYGMSEAVTSYLNKKGYGDSVILCTFPGGRGATSIVDMSKGSSAYNKFLDEIAEAYNNAQSKGWDFIVPAFCWMQGEDDIVWRKSKNYKKDLKKFQTNLNTDIKAITKQTRDVVCICYQTNCVSLSKGFNQNQFDCKETYVPQGQLELIRDDSLFMASGPTYPYSFVEEKVHIDGLSQKRLGYLEGLSAIRLFESKPSKGLIPKNFNIVGDTVMVEFNVPTPPLALDTLAVLKAANYGFSVIDSQNVNILQHVILANNKIKLCCIKSPSGSKVRYAVNGKKNKSGFKYGPRGNLRDSQGETEKATILNEVYPLYNWCYQFDELVK
ncbi:MAG: hypothetical protein JST58_04500 [Bacteroidetes bacterium]|nr:hypothetical protein [Bacteroidota bacterium]